MSTDPLLMPPPEKETFLNRTLVRLRRAWKDMRAGAVALVESNSDIPPDLPGAKQEAVRRQIEACIGGPGGEFAARARTAQLGRLYLSFNEIGRQRFLTLLAERFATITHSLSLAVDVWRDAGSVEERLKAERDLREALTPPRMRLMRQFNALPQGVKFLVDLRADLLKIRGQSPQLAALDDDLKELLVSWFDLGFLDLHQITWHSPAALLEKLIAYEAVHEIRSWDDLRNRLESDRRCFALFHPRMPDEPLAFVEVALVKGLAGDVQLLLDRDAPVGDPKTADTAIFYSISNTQRGLQGVSFGEHLIKKAAEALSHDVPSLKQFATLSPVPGFRRWLDKAAETHADTLFQPGDAERFRTLGASNQDAPPDSPEMRSFLERMGGWYFSQRNQRGQPIDPVARFHLRNGARLERINWPADRSANGWRQSYGLMVNYLYNLQKLEANHESYVREGTVVASRALREVTQKAKPLG
jgi:malonyl-CoA decarboxylase